MASFSVFVLYYTRCHNFFRFERDERDAGNRCTDVLPAVLFINQGGLWICGLSFPQAQPHWTPEK
jgi:hypothetical protein